MMKMRTGFKCGGLIIYNLVSTFYVLQMALNLRPSLPASQRETW